jgi:hypothetical protein
MFPSNRSEGKVVINQKVYGETYLNNVTEVRPHLTENSPHLHYEDLTVNDVCSKAKFCVFNDNSVMAIFFSHRMLKISNDLI